MRFARRCSWIAFCFVALALAVSVRGHEGHGGAEIGPYDLDSPRQVSPETAAHQSVC